jgi:hypothetical protein
MDDARAQGLEPDPAWVRTWLQYLEAIKDKQGIAMSSSMTRLLKEMPEQEELDPPKLLATIGRNIYRALRDNQLQGRLLKAFARSCALQHAEADAIVAEAEQATIRSDSMSYALTALRYLEGRAG